MTSMALVLECPAGRAIFLKPAHPTRRAGSQTFPQFPRRPVTTNASRLAEGCELLPDIARIDADNQTKIDPARNGQGEAALNGQAGSRTALPRRHGSGEGPARGASGHWQ